MSDRDQLLHLADRARRGVLLPEEGALLADAVTAMAKDLDFWKQLAQDAREAEERPEHDPACGRCTHPLHTGPLGPITPIRCTLPGCYWSVHGVPDKYVDSRARILAEHVAVEHAPKPDPDAAPADNLRAQLGAVLRRWGLLDEVNDPAATEAFVVTDLMSVLHTDPEKEN